MPRFDLPSVIRMPILKGKMNSRLFAYSKFHAYVSICHSVNKLNNQQMNKVPQKFVEQTNLTANYTAFTSMQFSQVHFLTVL